MSIISKVNAEPEKKPQNDLTLIEVDAIIRALSTSHFPTKDIEVLYNGIYKLQELRKRLDNGAKS